MTDEDNPSIELDASDPRLREAALVFLRSAAEQDGRQLLDFLLEAKRQSSEPQGLELIFTVHVRPARSQPPEQIILSSRLAADLDSINWGHLSDSPDLGT